MNALIRLVKPQNCLSKEARHLLAIKSSLHVQGPSLNHSSTSKHHSSIRLRKDQSSDHCNFLFKRTAHHISSPLQSLSQPRSLLNSNTVRSLVTRSSADLVTQPNLITMKLDSPEFKSIFTPELHSLVELFNKYGFEIRIAGGAVRDLLLGKIPADIDFATTATPSQMKDMFNKEGIRLVNANGESHGTITARINDKENFEVTTLRIDVVTDGRHAEVEFTKDWMLDSNRRDLTVNSMFLGFDGTVHDYFNGMEDLKDRRIRFVGDPVQRIQEDYLRILRYFRFYGRLATGPDCHEQVTLDAIKTNASGLERVSGERIWVEVRKILTGRMVRPILDTMVQLGVGKFIGLGNAGNSEELQRVCDITEGIPHHHMTRLAALFNNDEEVYIHHKRNKISNEELSTVLFIVHHRHDNTGPDLLSYCTDLHTDTAGKENKVVAKISELMKYMGHLDMAEQFPRIELPKFPVTGHDLTSQEHEVPRGPPFAYTLGELRRLWKESGYSMTTDQLVAKIPQVLESMPDNLRHKKKKR